MAAAYPGRGWRFKPKDFELIEFLQEYTTGFRVPPPSTISWFNLYGNDDGAAIWTRFNGIPGDPSTPLVKYIITRESTVSDNDTDTNRRVGVSDFSWKQTGTPANIVHDGNVRGKVRTMKLKRFQGVAGVQEQANDFLMSVYSLPPNTDGVIPDRARWVLCRIRRVPRGNNQEQPQGDIQAQPQGDIQGQPQGHIQEQPQGHIQEQPQGDIHEQPQGDIQGQPEVPDVDLQLTL